MKPEDEADFVAFVTASSPRLLHLAWLSCGDPHLAQELVQETFERVYVRWGRVGSDNPLAYSRRVLMNLRTDRWRRRRKETLSSDGAVPESAVGADEHRRAEDRDLLVRLLRDLPPRERQIVVLRHYDDMSEREVAEALGVSLGTVKSSASRGLATMRAALTQIQEV
ncbi:SigE family RNA polymerase sigma factor [Luteipulveratus halotolerans]|uniref:Uncharacterized protein n=1 Tax=Luteipulveratus halotolerans TaxID=1631356 RepID=A0A0L6CJM8_9MICO|nr:SigE family RNA polymerase sigma factor [Luteipulveratus halotolerans]KNX37723.1 hypothetical protein VV01_12130 [Luteipulveratus halotolerans]